MEEFSTELQYQTPPDRRISDLEGRTFEIIRTEEQIKKNETEKCLWMMGD